MFCHQFGYKWTSVHPVDFLYSSYMFVASSLSTRIDTADEELLPPVHSPSKYPHDMMYLSVVRLIEPPTGRRCAQDGAKNSRPCGTNTAQRRPLSHQRRRVLITLEYPGLWSGGTVLIDTHLARHQAFFGRHIQYFSLKHGLPPQRRCMKG